MKSETETLKSETTAYVIVFGLFLLIALVIYGNSLRSPFQFDDDGVIVKNLNVQDIRNLPYFFINPHLSSYNPAHEGHYRPLVTASYAINYAVGRLEPFSYHLVNLLLHTGSAFLVFLILQNMLKSSSPLGVAYISALAGGLIFLTHPFNSEAVNYITARSSELSGFFYMASFYFWVRYRQLAVSSKQLEVKPAHSSQLPAYYYAGSLLAFIAGMLSKEVVITLLVMIWVYDMYGFNKVSSKQLADKTAHSSQLTANYLLNWRNYLIYLPFILIVVIPYLIIRLVSYKKIVGGFKRDIFTQLLTEAPVLVKHWQMFFVPKGLSLFHDIEIFHGMTPSVLFSSLLLLLFFIAAFYLYRLKGLYLRIISFFILWFFVVLLPTTIIPLNMIYQENRGYLAIVSFAAIAGVIIGEISKKSGRVIVIVLVSLLVVVYGILTIQRNTIWQDSLLLWKDSVNNAPNSGTAYAGLAEVYRERGDLFLSLETAKKGVVVDPRNYNLRINLGRGYHLAGETDLAIKEYEEALRLEPMQAVIWNELATLYSKKGDFVHTEIYLKEGVKLWKDLSPIHYNLAVVLAAEGKFSEAEEEFRKAIELFPAYVRARLELAGLFEKTGRSDEALLQYREIVKYNAPELMGGALQFGQERTIVEKVIKIAQGRLESKAKKVGIR